MLALLFLGLLAIAIPPSRSTAQRVDTERPTLADTSREPANAWYLPHLDLGQDWQTSITLTNLEEQPLEVTLSAYEREGKFLGEIPAITSLEAQTTQTLEAEQMLPLGSKTLKVSSSGNLIGSSLFRTLDGKKAEVIPIVRAASRQLAFPRLVAGDYRFKKITLLNVDSASANLEVIAFNRGGVELQRNLLPTLSPMASHSFAVTDLFSIESLQQLATIRVISDRKIVGLQLVDPPDGDLVGLTALTTSSQEWYFPILTTGGDRELWTSVGLYNPDELSTSVRVKAFDAANNSLGIIDGATILPRATHFVITANKEGVIPPQTASLKVTAEQPISGYEVIGVKGGTGVAATLGIPAEDQTTVGFELMGSIDGKTLAIAPVVRMAEGSVRSTINTVEEGQWNKTWVNLPGADAENIEEGEKIKAPLAVVTEEIDHMQTTEAMVLSPPGPATAEFQQVARLSLPSNSNPQVAVGNVNGDAFSDLLISVPGVGGGSGELLLYLGSSAGFPSSPTTRREVLIVGGPGSVVLADVTGDGLDDAVVGLPQAEISIARGAGAVHVFRGMSNPPFLPVAPTTTLLPNQSQQGGGFGWSLDVGDFNGDGRGDVIVGEPRVNFAFIGPGRVTIYFGPIPPGTIRPNQIQSQELLGGQNSDQFGYVVAAANVIGGSQDDSVIGSPRFAPAGRVQVFRGTPAGVLTTADAIITGPPPAGSEFGRLFAVGDVDGNGFADLAIGRLTNQVQVFLSNGPNISTTPASTVTVPEFSNPTGTPASESQIEVAEVTGDGLADLIIGAPAASVSGAGFTGAIHIFAGSASPPGVLIPELQVIRSPNLRDYDSFGSAVAGGNLVGSAVREVVAVSPNSGFRNDEVFVFSLRSDADLALTKTASPNPVVPDSNLTYTITITNNGPAAAVSVTVTDNLPANTTFVSCNATGVGTCGGSGNNRTVTFTSLAAGASATITIVARVNTSVPNGTLISNSATVSSSTPDPNTDNNSATVTTTVSNPLPSVAFNLTSSSGSEVTTPANLAVSLSSPSGLPVTVNYAVTGGTATGGVDYTLANGTLTFTPGQTTRNIPITIINDARDEPDESIQVTLLSPTNAARGANAVHIYTILDNDPPPSVAFTVTSSSGSETTAPANLAVSLSTPSGLPVTVNYAVTGGTATGGGVDYTLANGTLTFTPGQTTQIIPITIINDTLVEPNETIQVTLSNPTNATLGANTVHTYTILDDVSPPTLQFSSSSYSIAENAGSANIIVTRSGDTSSAVTVNYATSNGTASDRSDYTTASGTLRFAAGETSKTFPIFITDDAFVEGNETVNLTLSNPSTGAALADQATATLTITDNDTSPSTSNPIDTAQFFVRQHYHDFLNREPDQNGLAFWTNNITSCGNDPQCIEVRRIDTSAAFFLSIEFQETGYLVHRFHKASYPAGAVRPRGLPGLAEFLPDTQAIGQGVVVGQGDWQARLEANKQAFANEFVTRPAFSTQYPQNMPAEQYVDALNANTGGALTQAKRDALVNGLQIGQETRATVLRKVAEDQIFYDREFNSAFVLMQYFGYLRRNPNDVPDGDLSGYEFWLNKLNSFDGDFRRAEMVKAFITSIEYRQRFGQP